MSRASRTTRSSELDYCIPGKMLPEPSDLDTQAGLDALAAFKRSETTSDSRAHLRIAIGHFGKAFRSTKDTTPYYALIKLSHSFSYLASTEIAGKAVSSARIAVVVAEHALSKLRQSGVADPKLEAYLNDTLGCALLQRFMCLNQEEDCEASILAHRAALLYRPPNIPPALISSRNHHLSLSLTARAYSSGAHEDLFEAMSLELESEHPHPLYVAHLAQTMAFTFDTQFRPTAVPFEWDPDARPHQQTFAAKSLYTLPVSGALKTLNAPGLLSRANYLEFVIPMLEVALSETQTGFSRVALTVELCNALILRSIQNNDPTMCKSALELLFAEFAHVHFGQDQRLSAPFLDMVDSLNHCYMSSAFDVD
ncbi:hypothetical protein FS749_012235, partial [Ceratobasidium sp. UAMH 11750]